MGASLCKFGTTLIQELGISFQSLREALPNNHYKIGMVIHIDIREVVNPFRSSWSRIHNTAEKTKLHAKFAGAISLSSLNNISYYCAASPLCIVSILNPHVFAMSGIHYSSLTICTPAFWSLKFH